MVLEVRSAELMESITRQAAERGVTYGAIAAEARFGGHYSRRRGRA
jgi:hypothetical protein